MKTSNARKVLSISTPAFTPATRFKADVDDLVMRASHGDRRAVLTITRLVGPMLRAEARRELGPYADEASDVVQDFLVFLIEGEWPYVPHRDGGDAWMRRIVRTIARTRRAQRQRDWGNRGDP